MRRLSGDRIRLGRSALGAVLVAALAATGAVVLAASAAAEASRTVGFWSMDETPGSTVLVDSSGNGRHGTIGADITTGAVYEGSTAHRYPVRLPAEAQEFPGHPSRVPHSTDLNPDAGDFSFTVRLRTTYAFGNILQKGQGSNADGYWKLQAPGGSPRCLFRGADGSARTGYTSLLINDGLWHTVTCVRTSTYVDMYVDGVKTARANGSSGTISNDWELTIGGKGSCNGTTITCDYFVGDIDYVRIEKGAATATNLAPVAALDAGCTGLVCTLDASGSTDDDGAVQSHVWDFGDGTVADTVSIPTTTHTYASPGTYTVTVTVTDDRGATSTTTQSVTVDPVAEEISFVGVSTSNANSASHQVSVPAEVEPGDALLLFLGRNNATTTTGPGTGWTQLDVVPAGSGSTTVWQRVAEAGDAGTSVLVTLSGLSKANLMLAAYRGTDALAPVAAFGGATDTASTATRVTPFVPVTASQSWALSYWLHGDSSTDTLTPPAGVTVRSNSSQTSGGRVTGLLADSAASVPVGTYGGLAATAAAASRTVATWTIVLQPDQGPPPPPVQDVITYVAQATSNVKATTHSVVVPAEVQPGDGLLMFLTSASLSTIGTPTGVSDWQELGTMDGGSARTRVWSKVAALGDTSATVQIGLDASAKANLVLVAYRGTDLVGPVQAFAAAGPTGSSATRVTPTPADAAPGAWAVSYWAHRDSSSTALVAPVGVVERSNGSQTGGGRVTGLLADSGVMVAAGPYGGLAAEAAAASNSGTTWTVLLAPDPGTSTGS